ncbi:hypothetical protein [Azospirillum sp. TSO5]|uniref:hypothetical protein n=1 Tax=Azospirillum sp. TSO5 TaxID=716760 RepID=UPI000D604FC7|nr:hypothetical protein [Azospirillum sp. TSO5]PWC92909.1 hypothetical protein TSO5_15895 [Azospirillum sp. TSO5]
MDDETLETFLRQQQEIESLAEDIACRVASLQARQDAVLEAVAGAREMSAEVHSGTKRVSQRLDLACSAMNTVSVVLKDVAEMVMLAWERAKALNKKIVDTAKVIADEQNKLADFTVKFMIQVGGEKAQAAARKINAETENGTQEGGSR